MINSSDPAVRIQNFATQLIRIARSTHKEHSLSSAQFSTMALLASAPGMTVVELARREGVAHPTMSRMVAGLTQDKLIERIPDPNDRRCARLNLTLLGEETYRDIAERRVMLFRLLLAQLKPETIDEILEVIERATIPIEAVLRNR